MSSSREQRRQLYERLVGQSIAGRYDVVSLMGFGGMGAVYEVIQRNMNRRIALKFIPSHNPITAARFEREALTVSQLRHPNTVTVFDYGQTEDGFLYLTMEMLAGKTLSDLIKEESPMPPTRAIHIAAQVCRSLSEAHRMGIVHRDIKPDNIFLIEVDGDPDVVKVLDFGIAKVISGEDDVQLTGDGRIIGTPRYMSPEQILSQEVDHRSDIYSLGCIIFEMLCAAPPFQASSTTALMISHAQDPPPPFAERLSEDALSHIPLSVEHVVRRALAKSPDDRQQTTDLLREELEAALTSLQAQRSHDDSRHGVTSPAQLPAGAKDAGSNKTGRLALVAIAIAIVLIIAFSFVIFSPSDDPTPLVQESEVEFEVDELAHAEESRGLAQVRIDSEPQGAMILADDEELGRTPLNISLASDVESVSYRLVLEGYEERTIDVAVTPGSRKRQEFSFLLVPVQEPEEKEPEEVVPEKTPKVSETAPKKTRRVEPKRTAGINTADEDEAKKDEEAKETTRVPRIDRLEDAPSTKVPKVERL
ncbi:MAG: serine/threonine-protein kinase [Bradymonadaceae bacterium]